MTTNYVVPFTTAEQSAYHGFRNFTAGRCLLTLFLLPRLYTIAICSCDVLALAAHYYLNAQAINSPKFGGNNMLLGWIIFQLVMITVYSTLTVEFVLRFLHKTPFAKRVNFSPAEQIVDDLDMKLSKMLVYLGLTGLLMSIRAVYRTAQFSDGCNYMVISTEICLIVLDGGVIVIAMTAWEAMHPAIVLEETPLKMQNSHTQGILGSYNV